MTLDQQEHPFRVVFCGLDMHYGFVFTKEALQGEPGVQVVQCERGQVAHALRTADVAVPLMSRLDAQLLRSAEQLKLIIQYGVGVEGVDIQTATDLGIWVTNIPSAGTGNALSCAEHAIFLMLATLRQHNAMENSIQQQQLGVPLGQTLFGKTVLIVGFGNIAKELAVRLQPFGVRILALRRKAWGGRQQHAPGNGLAAQQQQYAAAQQAQMPAAAAEAGGCQQQQQPPGGSQHQQHDSELDAAAESVLADRGCWPQDSARLAAQADIIALTCHQDEHNQGMINAEFLATCKSGVRIVNVARGGLLDYEAVRAALDSGRVAGLGLDVQAQEPVDPQAWLAQHPSVYLTPHIAGVTEMSYRSMAGIVASEVRRLLHGRAPSRLLNHPAHPRALDSYT